MRSSVEKKIIRFIAGLLMVCMLFPMLPAVAVEETEAVCTCGTVEGVHGEECAMYEAPAEGETTPETTEPENTEPETTEPETTEPETTEPETTEPGVTEPETTEPEVTEPETTEPEVTESETTEPETTEPEVTKPALVVEDEHEAQTLNEDTPTMTVTFDTLELAETTETIYKGWGFDESKVLKVSLTGLTPKQEYQVAIDLDKIVYYEPVPKTPEDNEYTVIFTQNEGVPIKTVDGEDSTYIKAESGTVLYTFKPAGTELNFSVNLRYDVTLWNHRKDANLRWGRNNDLVQVTLSSGGTEISSRKMDDATASKRHSGNMNDADGTNGIKSMQYGTSDKTTTFYMEHIVNMQIRSFAGEFYHEYLVVDVVLPHCTIDGQTYYMNIYGAETVHRPYDYVVADHGDGTARIYIPHIYQNSHEILNLLLVFPEDQLQDLIKEGQTIPFDYKFTYNIYSEVEEDKYDSLEEALENAYLREEPYVSAQYGEGEIYLTKSNGGELNFVDVRRGYASTNWTTAEDKAVASLGGAAIENNGTADCENIKYRMTFDAYGTNTIGVTSVNVMADLVSPTITVKYRMMDENGNIYPAETEAPAEITLTNAHCGQSTKGLGRYVTLHRGMLENTEHQQLYFKMVEYTIGKIEAGISLGYYGGSRSRYAPGAYWGYALKVGETRPLTKLEILSGTWTDESGTVHNVDSKSTELETKMMGGSIPDDKQIRMRLTTEDTGFLTEEIYAGDSATLEVMCRMDDQIDSQTFTYLDELRVGLLLPKGIVINESKVKAVLWDARGGPEVPLKEVIRKEVEDGEAIFWILVFEEGYPVGSSNEDLTRLDNGIRYYVTIDITTEKTLSDMTLVTHEILYAAGTNYNTNYAEIRTEDVYDLNGNGKTDDRVTSLTVTNTRDLIIRGNSVSLDITDEVLVNGKVQKPNAIAINSADDSIQYRMNIKNQNGGKAENFASYFKIPQELKDGAGDRIVMKEAATVENTEGSTELKLVYTTEAAADMDAAEALDVSKWTDTITDWSAVTWVKLVSADGSGIINGSESTATIPLAYLGDSYSYHAGANTVLNSEGSYDYVRGNFSLPIGIDTIDRTLYIHYKESSAAGETTLTAALDRKPTYPNVNSWVFGVGGEDTDDDGLKLKFFNPQTFKVENLNEYNVELVDVDYDAVMKSMSSEESNKKYMIKAGLTSAGTAILDGVELGTLAKDVNASFLFELYNGNILTDAATQRYVTFDLVSDYVTIPVKINIQQEATLAEAGAPAIVAGKRYAPITDSTATSVNISKDSAFTAQFVVDNMNANYGARTLIFGNALPAGTTIVLIDYAELTAPRYARYVANSGEREIPLTGFTMMGSTAAYSSYTIPAGSTETSFKEQLLFVVDFPGENGTSNSIHLKIDDTTAENKDVETDKLEVTTAAKRGFSATISANSAPLGSEFTLSVTVTAAGAADSRYDGRQMAFVIDGSTVPADGRLTVDGVEYKRNSQNQYIIPMGVAQTSGTYSKKLVLEAASLKNGGSCTLNADLWVSATAQAAKPGMGDRVVTGLSINLTTAKEPSLKVDSMSQRVLTKEELKSDVSLVYQTKDIPGGAKVTLEVQKAIGSTYITDSVYAEQVTGSTNVSMGVYTVPGNGGNLTLRFSSSLEAGNYRILFKVTDSSGNVLLEVPYRFVVVD